MTKKHSRATMRVHPLVAESLRRLGARELVLDRASDFIVAVDVS